MAEISVAISVDVPSMAEGVQFYESAFGFRKTGEPIPGVVVLHSGNTEICLLETSWSAESRDREAPQEDGADHRMTR
jgi:hypothetical protein